MTDVVSTAAERFAGPAPLVLRWSDGAMWDRFVAGASDGTLAHRWAWRDVISRTYGHHVINLAAVRGDHLAGVLPLVLVRSRLFGRQLVSMPYLDYGGVCANGDADTEAALVTAATELATRHRAPLEMRHLFEKDLGMPASLEKVTLTLDISAGEEDAWSRIRSNRRGQIRKARREGLTASVGGVEAVGAFYRVWATNMRDLGSPVHPRSYFHHILTAFPDDARVILVEEGPRAVGAGIVIRHGDRVVLPWSSSLRQSLTKGPNQLLYWEAIRHAIGAGATTFDFGRSSRGAGTFDAKREWGAEAVQLYWHGPDVDDGASRLERLAWAAEVWRRMPLAVTVALGSRLRGGITR
jgi:FemAB-related protein (PEP-CTERM system-associated)